MLPEQWMLHTFGQRIGDYLRESRSEPLGLAAVEVDRLLKVSGVRRMLTQWRSEDVKSPAGRKSILDETAALSLILLQIRLGRPTMITEMTQTMLQLSPTHRKILHLPHDGLDAPVYERIWAAIQRLIHLVDEFPGRRDKVLTQAEFRQVVANRDLVACEVRRTRMFELANALVHASWLLLPEELRNRYEGNTAIDATFVPLYGKAGNPSSRNLDGDRRTANPFGGWYRREGDHGAVTHADARALNKSDPKGKHKGTSAKKLQWGVEAEIARMTANHLAERDQFPLLTTGLSFHIPGAVSGEGLRMLESLIGRGHHVNLYIMDRAYSNAKYLDFQVPARRHGVKLVFDYKATDLGVKAHDKRGFIQVSGAWYLDTLPVVHREADGVILAARTKYGHDAARLAKAEAAFAKTQKGTPSRADDFESDSDPDPPGEVDLTIDAAMKKYRAAARSLALAEELYAKQFERRAHYMLKAKGQMSQDGTRRYLMPEPSEENNLLKAPHRYKQKTVMMKLPTNVAPNDANPGGLKHEQYFPWGGAQWSAAYGMRNGVESVNRNLKRSQYEDIANPDNRAVRGNTFTYLIIALATVVENMRQILSFYKRKLAIDKVTAKNREIPGTFWQSTDPAAPTGEGPQPPG
jgi:hypothetical protein